MSTQQDTLYPILDDLIWDTDYYPATAREQLARELYQQYLREQQWREDQERAERLRRRQRVQSIGRTFGPALWVAIILVLIGLALGGAQWVVGLL